MKVGVLLPPEFGQSAEPAWVTEFATKVEALGFDEISVVEHSVVIGATASPYPYSPTGRSPLPDDCPLPDPLELLAFLAARTERLGLATGVLVLPNHHPVVLAKRLATLDRLAGGRLRICVGLGWMREEIEACGGDFDRRGVLADESIALMRALWAGDDVTFTGATYSVERAYSRPRPVQPGGVPLYVGGHSQAAARRAGRLGDGFQPLGLAGDALRGAVATMRGAADDAGRDPDSLGLVLGATLGRVDAERVERARAQGASHLLLSPSAGAETLEQLVEQLESAAARIGGGR